MHKPRKHLVWVGAAAVLAFAMPARAEAPKPLGLGDPPPIDTLQPPGGKNIFFPTESPGGPSAAPGTATRAVPKSEFVLAGTVVSAAGKKALLEFPSTGRLEWVAPGDMIGEMMVADVTDSGVSFKLGKQDLALAVGRPEADLYEGRRVLHGGFEVVGVCKAETHQFALVKLDSAERIERVGLKDRLEAGTIIQIDEGGIILQSGGSTRMVSVGKHFAGGVIR